MTWWRRNDKKLSKEERIYQWQSGLILVMIIIVPQLVMSWDRIVYKGTFITAWVFLICALLFLRILVPYQPIKDIKLRRMNVAVDWHQVYGWLKQKHVKKVYGDPKAQLDNVLQEQAPGDEFIIQVEYAAGWHDVGYVRTGSGQPIIVADKSVARQKINEMVQDLLKPGKAG